MALEFTTSYLTGLAAVFRYYKRLAERAMEQVSDEQLFAALDPEANSIAIIVKHMAGNMRSRWTNFLTTDGEKPDRNRDSEFVDPPATREALLAEWEDGWSRLFAALEPLTDADLGRTVTIRGEAHSVMQAINRQLGALRVSRGPDCAAGKTFCRRPLAIAQRAAQSVGRVQSQSRRRRTEPELIYALRRRVSAASCKMLRMETIQYNLPQSRIPQAWYNILPDLPKPLAPPLHPGTLKPHRPRRSGAAVSHGAHHAGSQRRARDRDSGRGAADLCAVASFAAHSRAPA